MNAVVEVRDSRPPWLERVGARMVRLFEHDGARAASAFDVDIAAVAYREHGDAS